MSTITLSDIQIETMAAAIHSKGNEAGRNLTLEELKETLRGATSEAQPQVDASCTQTICFSFEALTGDLPLTPVAKANIESVIHPEGWALEVLEGAHGLAQLILHKETAEPDSEIVYDFVEHVRQLVDVQSEIGEALPVKDSFAWVETPDSPTLHVNFLYKDNNEVRTANVASPAWVATRIAGIEAEMAMLLLYRDIEIDPGYDTDDIQVLGVMTSQEFYNG